MVLKENIFFVPQWILIWVISPSSENFLWVNFIVKHKASFRGRNDTAIVEDNTIDVKSNEL